MSRPTSPPISERTGGTVHPELHLPAGVEPDENASRFPLQRSDAPSLLTIILVVLIVLWLGGSFPRAGSYNAGWGYAPAGLGTILLIVLLVMVLDGRI